MAVVTTGFFDGVHTGHRYVIEKLVSTASERGDESLVVTFWPHPRTIFQRDARDLRILNSLEEKKEILRSLGVDRVEVLPFTKSFAALTAEQYLRDVLAGRYGARAVIVGYDNTVGSDLLGIDGIRETAAPLGLEVIPAGIKSLGAGEINVSSTKIRQALESGDIAAANAMLGYPYGLKGVVVAGNRLGRTIGFPTANMQMYEPLKLIPSNGVYVVDVNVLGKEYRGMCNIGVRPTVGGSARTIETNIFDFDEDIYGLDLSIRFRRFLRPEKKFSSLEELKCRLALDRIEAEK